MADEILTITETVAQLVETTTPARVVVDDPDGPPVDLVVSESAVTVTGDPTTQTVNVGMAGPQGPPGPSGGPTDHGLLTGLSDDDHAQYQLRSEKGLAGGYAALDGTGTVPDAQLPAAIARDTEVTAAVSTHEAAGNPHPTYATDADLAAHAAAADPHAGYALDADLTAHGGAADPHTGYQRESEKGQLNGYPGLDASGFILDSVIPAGIARDSEVTAAIAAQPAVKKLGEVNGTGASAVLEIASIPSGYSSLIIEFIGRSTVVATGTQVRLTFETTPTAGAYDHQRMYGQGTLVGADDNMGAVDYITLGSVPGASSPANLHGGCQVSIFGYARTDLFKIARALVSGLTDIATGFFNIQLVVGVWESNAALDRVRLTLAAGNWTATSRLVVYGLPA